MEITPGTWTVKFGQPLTDKQFTEALDFTRAAGGTYDKRARTWTIFVAEREVKRYYCAECGGTGKERTEATGYCELLVVSGKRACQRPGRHLHLGTPCPACDGTGWDEQRTQVTPDQNEWRLHQLASRFGAQVLPLDAEIPVPPAAPESYLG